MNCLQPEPAIYLSFPELLPFSNQQLLPGHWLKIIIMYKNTIKTGLISLLLSVFTMNGLAQQNPQSFELGAGLAGFVYQGDLTPDPLGSYRTMRPGLVLSAARVLSPSFIVRVNASFGGLRGDETKYDNPEFRKHRAFRFRTPVAEISPQLVWNPLGKNNASKGFSPYLFGGAGLAFFKIRRDHSDFDAAYFADATDIADRIATDDKQSPPNFRIVIPAGVGVRYNLSDRFAVNAETAYRFPFTDYLDGFSKSVNPEQGDHYHSIMVGAIYRLGNKSSSLACPVLKY